MKKPLFSSLLFLTIIVISTNSASAVTLENPLAATDICDLLKGIVEFLIQIGAPIAAAMIIYGAYQMMFSAGKPESVKKGRDTILYTLLGYGIIVIGWGFVYIINDFLGGKTAIC